MVKQKENNGTNNVETAVHFKTGEPDAVHIASTSKSPSGNVHKKGCIDLPVLFERAGSWWPTPRFDSDILENEQWKCYFPQTKRRFQTALFYILVACISWAIYFGARKLNAWPYFIIGTLILLCIIGLILGFTYTEPYKKWHLITSVVVSILICSSILLTLMYTESDLSMIGAFTASVEVLLMMYSVIPMPLYMTVVIGVLYSVLFEWLTVRQNNSMKAPVFLSGKILLHLCIHLMGIHIFTMRQVRQRSTFWKVGQSVISQKDLELEMKVKETMIHSLMPPKVAAQVMKSKADKEEDGNEVQTKKRGSKTKKLWKGAMIFRTFNMNRMENVSILFADIVGFTKMSSNKSAEVLVGQLNDLFGRFDVLCTASGCEKISTLGDCYYCVSGCPEPRDDHAKCCVEMGLGMIDAIKKFDKDNNEEVNMRVGVHTGTVLCGIVGTRRFKFDVWSNDVTLANNMESTGQPGRIHISEATLAFLKDEYEVEQGEEVEDNRSERTLVEGYDKSTSQYAVKHTTLDKRIKTYFIIGRTNAKLDGTAEILRQSTEVLSKLDEVTVNLTDSVGHATESDTLMNDLAVSDRQINDANGIPTTVLVSSHLNNSLCNLDQKGTSTHLSVQTLVVDKNLNNSHCPSPSLLQLVHPNSAQNSKNLSPTNSIRSITELDSMQSSKPDINFLCGWFPPSFPDNSKWKSLYIDHTGPSPIFKRKISPSVDPFHIPEKVMQHMCAISELSSFDVTPSQPGLQLAPFESGDSIHSQQQMNKTWDTIQESNYQNDVRLVSCIKETKTDIEYFLNIPINRCMLTFTDAKLEENYRDHYMEDQHNQHTLSAPKYHSFLEILVSFLIFAIISIFCFVVYDCQLPWIIFFCSSLILEILNLIRGLLTIKYSENKYGGNWLKMIHITSGWYFRNFLGAIIASFPLLGVFSNFSCHLINLRHWNDAFFCFCIVVSLLHYTNFTTLSSWMKSMLANVAGVVLFVLIAVVKCIDKSELSTESPYYVTTTQVNNHSAETPAPTYRPLFSGVLQYEIILDMILLILLIGFLNRESEISYRLNYHGDAQAWKYKRIMQENRDQADWLLHNIIPQHVSEVVRKTSKYSKNHKGVGVIFAAIVNFNEIYDESFQGGREFLRVLNELVSDYEELLDNKRFKDVEKIKTISSTFMAASGLNELSRAQNNHPYAHLYALMEFCTELHNVVRKFNDSIFNFDFILNIGYNYGEVTAGVIGTTKLLYDIWGDTVNIASRMYSTGEDGKIQVPEATAILLGDKMDFEYRGEISVKGKGMMKTYLYSRTREGAHWD